MLTAFLRFGPGCRALRPGGIAKHTHFFHCHQRTTGDHLVENRRQSIDVRLVVHDLDDHGQIG